MSAMEQLIRTAMGSGVACFVDRVRAGQVVMDGPLTDAFGDFPVDFINTRRDLIRRAIAEACADAIEGTVHLVDDDESAQVLARTADQWREEATS